MITEPHFPKSYTDLIEKIVACELKVDQVKAKINTEDAEKLFNSIDHLNCGQIFVEDLYAFLKKNGVTLTKKEVKFVNKYFGFSCHQKLEINLFRAKFLLFMNPQFQKQEKMKNSQEGLLNMINLALKSYGQIEEMRLNAVLNLEQIYDCVKEFYPNKINFLTQEMLKQSLSCLNLYSRLNTTLLCKYILGEESKEVSLKQVFWKDDNSATIDLAHQWSNTRVNSMAKGVNNFFISKQENKIRDLDILTQIDNIQAAYRSKKEENPAKNKNNEFIIQKEKISGQLNRYSGMYNHQVQQQNLEKQKLVKKRYTSQCQNIDKKYGSREVDQILKRSLKDDDENEFQLRQKQIDILYRKRKLSQTREEVVSRASSAAKLKIQEIERKVFSRNKISGTSLSGLRTPSLVSIKADRPSRFSSLKRK